MAAAFARRLSGGTVEVESAGTAPSDEVSPVVVAAMAERGVDLSQSTPRPLTRDMVDRADRIVTMGCEVGPDVGAAEDWRLDDPEGKTIEEVRRIRDDIEVRVRGLLAKT
jgi:protein-tyrosine-phosphatase